MKRNIFRNKIYLFLSIFLICSISLCSFFILGKNNYEDFYTSAYVTNSDEENNFISKLSEKKVIDTNYNLTEHYPIMVENQTNSDFCWIYSSAKVLETSLMVQKNEYHNFSEMGIAYLNFVKKTLNQNGIQNIDSTGNFEKFDDIVREYGVIYESTFSNDLYYDMNESNYENYSYILNYIDTSLMKNISHICISGSTNYIELEVDKNKDINKKVDLIKAYIKNYGGIFAGIEPGSISAENNKYSTKMPETNTTDDGIINENHAVCLVGWSDNLKVFYAINSWGVSSNSYSLFQIPYDYLTTRRASDNKFPELYGYVCNDKLSDILGELDTSYNSGENGQSKNKISSISSSAGGEDGLNKIFQTNEKTNLKELNNFFVYNESIKFDYKISNIDNFDNVFINIYRGIENVTHKFSINFDESNYKITISSDESYLSELKDGFIIKFTYLNEELITYKDFYVLTGNEVSYIELNVDNEKDYNFRNTNKLNNVVTLCNNNFASGQYSQSYQVYSYNNSYNLRFYLPSLNFLGYQKINFEGLEINELDLSSGEIVENNSSITIDYKGNNGGTIYNFMDFKISNLSSNTGKTFFIKIKLSSLYTSSEDEYNFVFNIINVNATTKSMHKITYILDEGKNSEFNINRFTDKFDFKFVLQDPKKFGYGFLGWFTDKNYKNKIEEIDNTLLNSDIVIYARWASNEKNYFNINLKINQIINHDNVMVDYKGDGQKITYGDSVILKFEYSPISADLTTYSYSSKYKFYFNENLIYDSIKLDKDGNILEFENSYINDNLVCGKYVAKIVVSMVISHSMIIEKEKTVEYEILPKDDVTVTFDPDTLLIDEYDGNEHKPNISFNGIYNEDKKDFDFTYKIERIENNNVYVVSSAIDAGEYRFSINSINNPNYSLSGITFDTLKINKKFLSIEYSDTVVKYNGTYQSPKYEISGVTNNEHLTIRFSEIGTGDNYFEKKDVGVYNIRVVGIENSDNYQFRDDTECRFEITKSTIYINFHAPSDVRFTIAPSTRKSQPQYQVTWDISGDFYDAKEDLDIDYETDGFDALTSGNYPVTGILNKNNVSKNYVIEFNECVYRIEGYYYVFFTLPNGNTYVQKVDEGENPTPISNMVYKTPFLTKIVYDRELIRTSEDRGDIYVNVELKSYVWVFWFSLGVGGILVAYLVMTSKERKNKTR